MAKEGEEQYAYLDHLTAEELESILRGGLLLPEEEDPKLTDYILEVLVKREKQSECNSIPDLNHGWTEFNAHYRDMEKSLYPMDHADEVPDTPNEPVFQSPRPKKRRIFRVLAAAVVAALVATTVPVAGFPNLIQAVARWTAGQFSFQVVWISARILKVVGITSYFLF